MTVAEAAQRLEVSQDLVYRLCADGRLSHRRVGRRAGRGRIRIDEAAIEAYLRSCEVTTPSSSGHAGAKVKPRSTHPGLRSDGKPFRYAK